jgi:hypothetical protein
MSGSGDTGAGGDTYTCGNCGTVTDREGAIRGEPMADLDPDRWQTLCCPACGARLATVLVD